MVVRYFPAVLERVSDGFSVFFPDLPGCTSAGDTMEDAARQAEEALALHLQGLIEDGTDFPTPTPLDADRKRDPEVEEAARILVRAELPGRAVRLNLTMEEGLLAATDAAARRRGQSRSAFVAEAVRSVLRGQAAS